MTHWAEKYIGRAWINGQFDCWGLVQEVYKNELNIELSPIVTNAENIKNVYSEFAKSNNYSHLQEATTLKDKSIVVLSQGKYPNHVGLWADIDGGGIIHNLQDIGVVFQKMTELKLSGWQILGIWEYLECK